MNETCTCGHVEDEHLDNGSCDIEDCGCGGFEPENDSPLGEFENGEDFPVE